LNLNAKLQKSMCLKEKNVAKFVYVEKKCELAGVIWIFVSFIDANTLPIVQSQYETGNGQKV